MYDQAIERYEIEPLKIKKGIETKGGVKCRFRVFSAKVLTATGLWLWLTCQSVYR